MSKNISSKDALKFSDKNSFVENIYCDEIRSGFLVTSHRKKLWNVQIGLINELARICDKYNIKWFAYGGTLLGAARHQGFIPWDDDVDIIMLRHDYEKFKQVCEKEIKYPFFCDNWYSHRLESDELKGIKSDSNLPLITVENQKKHWYGFPTFPIIKIRDSRTTMIEFPDRINSNQGIWIDIFPLDPIPPFQNEHQALIFESSKLLLLATVHPDFIRQLLQKGQKFILSPNDLNNFLNLPFYDKGKFFDKFTLENFSVTSNLGDIDSQSYTAKKSHSFETKWFDDVEYMPFEKIKIPVPVGWENFLTAQFGDWRTPKIFATHQVENWSTDIPYDEYYKKIQYTN